MTLPQIEIKPDPINWDGLPKRYMNPFELETLCHLIREHKPKVVIEFGINSGRTAKAILRESPGIKKYVGVDVPFGYVTEKNVQRKEVPVYAGHLVEGDTRVEVIIRTNGTHDLMASDLPEADVVFIDGDHSRFGVEHDTALAYGVVRKGGLVLWHDYNDVKDKKTGGPAVDVKAVLDDLSANGHDIKHIKNTWIAYEVIK